MLVFKNKEIKASDWEVVSVSNDFEFSIFSDKTQNPKAGVASDSYRTPRAMDNIPQ